MRRKGGQRLLYALLVADIHQHAAEDAQLAVVGAGHQQTAHRHQREQSQRFEGDGFAARIGSRDDEGVKIRAEADVDGHHPVLGNQRMPRLLQTDDAPVVDDGLGGAHGVRQIRLGENKTELRQIVVAADDGIREVARVGGQLKEDALDLLLLLVSEHADVVVRLHDAHRLDEHRLTARGGVVHQARDAVAALGAHGHDISAAALGDDGVLQIFDVRAAVDDLVEHLARLGGGGAYLAADIGEGAARLVGDLVLAEDGGGDFFFEIFVGDQPAEIAVERRLHRGAARLPLLDRADDAQGTGDLQQLARRQAASRLRAAQVARAVDRSAEGRRAEAPAQHDGVVGLPQQTAHLFDVGLRLERQRQLVRVAQRGLCRQLF